VSEITSQELFWKNEFGEHYIERNIDSSLLKSNIVLFSKILKYTSSVNSVIEFGCNVGLNLDAITFLNPKIEVSGVEINKKACEVLKNKGLKFYNESFLSQSDFGSHDLTFTKGVLIHVNPEKLKLAYEKLFNHSKKYILIVEYYNPTPVTIDYRGEKDKLFKRDFAGEMLEVYPEIKLINYGFTYHKDPFPQDDNTWFLFEKLKT
jgi:spore coat polysaccharide biosynthesis protein SpsF